MTRDLAMRRRRQSKATLAAGLAVLAGALSAVLLTSPAAHAAPQNVGITLTSTGPSGEIDLTTGDSVTISAKAPSGCLGFNAVLNSSSFPGGGSAVNVTSNAVIYTFNSSGSYGFKWAFTCVFPAGSGSATIVVSDPPPPPVTSANPPPTSTAAGGGGATSASSSPGSTPTSGAAGGTGSTGKPGTSGSASKNPPNGGGGISFPTDVAPEPVVNGFAAPSDPNGPTPSVSGGEIVSGKGSTALQATTTNQPTAASSETTEQVDLATSSGKGPSVPTSLAISSIGALAIVSSIYAYRMLGRRA